MLIVVFQKIHNGEGAAEEEEEEQRGEHLEESSAAEPSLRSWEGSKSRAQCELSCTLETTKYFPLSARPRPLGPARPGSARFCPDQTLKQLQARFVALVPKHEEGQTRRATREEEEDTTH